jgi:DNA-directed RNA polymerase specialized sigma24 family protein
MRRPARADKPGICGEYGGSLQVNTQESAHQKWSVTQEAFDGFLASLSPDRDRAADRYLEVRRNLVRLFEWRGCSTPDEYADEAMNRCARKIAEGEEIRDVATYCIGIGRTLLREMSRERLRAPVSIAQIPEPRRMPEQPNGDAECRLECLSRCLAQLSPEDRYLILTYYQGDKAEKINTRKKLTQVFGVGGSTLRMRALRIREKLQGSVENCLRRSLRRDQHGARCATLNIDNLQPARVIAG